MELRDTIAVEAMKAIMSNQDTMTAASNTARKMGCGVEKSVATVAYGFADAMLKAREVK